MVVLGMQTGHGRSTPLVWKTVARSALRDQRNEHEDALLVRFAALVPGEVRVTVVTDRGFGDSKLYRFLTEEVGFDYIIRFRGVIWVEADQRQAVPVVVCVQDKAMKDPWCLATSRSDPAGSALKRAYGMPQRLRAGFGRRFTVEETFRDMKNPRLGLGLKQTVVRRNERRDALFLLAALTHALLTLLGKTGQELGMERWLGATRPGGISLFRQGLLLYELIPTMQETDCKHS